MSSKIYELSNLFKKYEDMKEIEKTDKILFTKFKSIDKFTDGLQNRQLFILAARPGVGKTTLLQNIMNNASKQLKADEYILFLSLELSVVDVYKRFLQIESDILTKSDINDYEPNDQIKLEFEKIKTKFANKNILIFDNETNEQITPTYIQKMLSELKERNIKIKAIFIDYFQLLDSNLFNAIEYKAQEDTSKQLKQIAKINNINVFCLAQLSREYEKRKTVIPTFSDLKGTSSIEQDADVIMFLYSQDNNILNNNSILELQLTIAKNRNGLCNTSSLIFNTEQGKFYEKDNFIVIEKTRSEKIND
ncbi:DnaB-like helicase C-terminal domain-containing protein [Metamycoplasma hyosynoviae]|uniref:DnaB-like helicase C-terminal domain-containing protein n=2 Tax=Metamycoplasma hyosynoviae TaxID=29559 RepID=UPI00106549C3|nr:DnaB-like helicase C-terminal domain-containing protein [Metamycoplasma hyosynoviae]MDD1372249.1 DnaB-like helicase C-terminal domain-containing protein [Metamycoplasma hyosynoviae]MDD7898045.1 DnaB-like helicase C-terminal domain-containing protein [Metamycoplasma hyosynoviae]MDD7912285.1 DnaB-like helicase C-terminal domain-containing protein [Metamycoplasma hyosynoviae]